MHGYNGRAWTQAELASAEREELVRLRRQYREQLQTIKILGKATVFFAT
ncbi:hypothetical protein ACH4U6_36785 [Streptomyces netropsis]